MQFQGHMCYPQFYGVSKLAKMTEIEPKNKAKIGLFEKYQKLMGILLELKFITQVNMNQLSHNMQFQGHMCHPEFLWWFQSWQNDQNSAKIRLKWYFFKKYLKTMTRLLALKLFTHINVAKESQNIKLQDHSSKPQTLMGCQSWQK